MHGHRIDFRREVARQGGVSLLLTYYTGRDELYYMRYEQMKKFWDRGMQGGRKSFRYDELEPEWFMQLKNGYFVPYLDYIQKDLDLRD